MKTLPTIDDVRALLEPLTTRQIQHLATLSGVPYDTIIKIRYGKTTDPRLSTVTDLLPHIKSAARTQGRKTQ